MIYLLTFGLLLAPMVLPLIGDPIWNDLLHWLRGHRTAIDSGFWNHLHWAAEVYDVHVVCSCGKSWWREGRANEHAS